MQQENERKVTFSHRLKDLMDLKGVNNVALAKAAGVSHVSVGKYLDGTSIPSADKCFSIARFLDVSVESFFTELSEDSKIDGKAERSESPKLWNGPYYNTDEGKEGAPIISWASAGSAHAWEDQGNDVPRIKTNCKDHNCYALELVGDSMTPIYQPGDIIVCSPNLVAQPMDLIMLKTQSDDVYFKRYLGEKKSLHRFESFNPNYPVMEFKASEIDKIHVVHSVVRIFKGRFF